MTPRLLTRRPHHGKYRQVRCALCYHRFWPWQQQIKGANYFPHPWMQVHVRCAWDHYPVQMIDQFGARA